MCVGRSCVRGSHAAADRAGVCWGQDLGNYLLGDSYVNLMCLLPSIEPRTKAGMCVLTRTQARMYSFFLDQFRISGYMLIPWNVALPHSGGFWL